ncbi:MAG TPA: ligase-associated DNA damage response endonuclease PdeM [Chitinophagaceae bacterium]|nr:ligase-associated DNA damage response endonuclease PdeM [Chitinophagaceae bacterium]
MTSYFRHTLKDQTLWLSADRCLFWEDQQVLVVSDLHLGKTGHFRKAGIPVPQQLYVEDLQRLVSQLQYFRAGRLLIVGDLFHSHFNKELDLFRRWRDDFPALEIHLVKGNHDILQEDWYRASGIRTWEQELELGPFLFRHDLEAGAGESAQRKDVYLFSGHIHPGISLHGMGKQSLRFPCFYFTDQFCVLPAFGRFTGTYRVEPRRRENVFAIVENKILQVQ